MFPVIAAAAAREREQLVSHIVLQMESDPERVDWTGQAIADEQFQFVVHAHDIIHRSASFPDSDLEQLETIHSDEILLPLLVIVHIVLPYQVMRHDRIDFALVDNHSVLQDDPVLAQRLDAGHVVADEQDRAPLPFTDIPHLADGLLLELRIPHGQDLVHHQDFGFQVRRDGEAEPDRHTGRIPLDRGIDIAFAAGELDDLVQFPRDVVPGHAHDRAVHIDILTAGHFPVETRAHLQEGADAPAGADGAHRRARHLGQEFQERALPRPVLADDTHDISLFDLEVDVPEGPDILAVARHGPVVGLADLEVRIFLAQDAGLPPTVQVVRQGLGGYQAQPVLFSYVIEFNRCCHVIDLIVDKVKKPAP